MGHGTWDMEPCKKSVLGRCQVIYAKTMLLCKQWNRLWHLKIVRRAF
jgi:hypothetical protein